MQKEIWREIANLLGILTLNVVLECKALTMVTQAVGFHKRFMIRILKFCLETFMEMAGNGSNSDKHR